jgi:hypothetical protein
LPLPTAFRYTVTVTPAVLVVLLVGPVLASGNTSRSLPQGAAAPAKKTAPAEVKMELVLTRADSGGDAAQAKPTDGKTVTLGTPTLTTLDGGTATLSVTGTDLSYNVALSPLVETTNNTGGSTGSGGGGPTAGTAPPTQPTAPTTAAPAAPAPTGPSVRVQWNIRLAGKSLPGATTCAISGASRLEIGKEGAISEIRLTDPNTGRATTFRLVAKITMGSGNTGSSAGVTDTGERAIAGTPSKVESSGARP